MNLDHAHLLHQFVTIAAARLPESIALTYGELRLTYGELACQVERFAAGLHGLGLERSDRVAVYLDKRQETVVACFAAAAAGGAFVPINPLLKPAQVGYVLRDCNARILVTSPERAALLRDALADCAELRHVIVTDSGSATTPSAAVSVHAWQQVLQEPSKALPRVIDNDLVAILYTSGSTGSPKGVVLSHRNMVIGAKSVAEYLENASSDTLLAALPLSFDAGFSQLTTAFHAGARVVLLNYLLPKDVLNALVRERVTGLTAVPPLYIQLAQLDWPATIDDHLRYFANTGGRLPRAILDALRKRVPAAKPFLMYGLTEAFRSTFLPPEEVDRRPDSIGKAIPNAEIMVLRENGTSCDPGEPGELVHRGGLVALGYWNDPAKTAERFRALPLRESGLVLPEIAVYSGDTVRADDEGYLYFVGRRDEMIKTSGYRVSPTEIEEVLYGSGMVGEAAAFGVAHPALGQAIVVIATIKDAAADAGAVLAMCRARLPAYMVPAHLEIRPGPLPRNANGKIDRSGLRETLGGLFQVDDNTMSNGSDRKPA